MPLGFGKQGRRDLRLRVGGCRGFRVQGLNASPTHTLMIPLAQLGCRIASVPDQERVTPI